jgi:hypothetical protein
VSDATAEGTATAASAEGARSEPQASAATRGASEATSWRALFVVGAGRSGTSALTRGLQALGVELGDRLKAPTGKNPTGFFEDRDLLDIAKRARSALGLGTASVALVEPEDWRRVDLSELEREAAETMHRRFGTAPVWGFKYAQTLRLLPFWEQVFQRAGLDAAFVVAARNPLSVARSRAALDAARGVQEKSDLEWLVNVVPYFRQMAEHPFVVVDYDLLMDDPEAQLERVATRLGLPLDASARAGIRAYADGFLDADRRHTRFSVDDLEKGERLNPLVRDAYRWLYRLASDEISPDARELWDDWARLEATLAAMAPLLRHVDRLEGELARRRFHPWTALRAAWINLPRPWRSPAS